MSGLIGVDVGGIITGIGKVADDLFTSDEERAQAELAERELQLKAKELDVRLNEGQTEINKTEAQHASIFVAGWRPACGWIGAVALGYQFIAYPLLVWAWSLIQANGYIPKDMQPPPVLDADALWVLLSGMMGIAGLRSFDKMKGTQTDRVVK